MLNDLKTLVHISDFCNLAQLNKLNKNLEYIKKLADEAIDKSLKNLDPTDFEIIQAPFLKDYFDIHTKFDLYNNIPLVEEIRKLDGIERARIDSRYKISGIKGKLFEFDYISSLIEKTIVEYIFKKVIRFLYTPEQVKGWQTPWPNK